MFWLKQLFNQNFPWMLPDQLFLHKLNSFQVYFPLWRFLWNGDWNSFRDDGKWGILSFTFPNPFHQRVIDKYITKVNYNIFIDLESRKGIDHSLFENSFISDWFHDFHDAFSQSERNQLRNGQVSAWTKTVAKINNDDWSWRRMNQEVLQMSVTDTQNVSNDTNNSIIG